MDIFSLTSTGHILFLSISRDVIIRKIDLQTIFGEFDSKLLSQTDDFVKYLMMK